MKNRYEPELGSVQHPIFVENRDALPQYNNTELESDSGPSAGGKPALLHYLKARTQRHDSRYFRESKPTAHPFNL
jgi:hypothetical protein